jgi:plasmid stability protein
MPNLTVRDIPSDILDKIRILSQTERRSINSEMLLILENGLKHYISDNVMTNNYIISKENQLEIWSNLSGKWQDKRQTDEITDDIYAKRTMGREVDL